MTKTNKKMCNFFFFTDELTITPIDTRWVGAWWFGILICAGVNVLTAIPFFFLPKTLAKEGSKDNADIVKNDKEEKQKEVKKENDGITKGKYKNFKYYIIYFLFYISVSLFESSTITC